MKFSSSKFGSLEYRVWSLGVNQGAKARWMEAQKSKCKGAKVRDIQTEPEPVPGAEYPNPRPENGKLQLG
jgi:hypothetical protein